MPIVGDAAKVLAEMKRRYGAETGERIFYATAKKQYRIPETWKKADALACGLAKTEEGKKELSQQKKDAPKQLEEQLAKGTEVEKEHTCKPEVGRQIAKDHLVEDEKYYTHLHEMEAKHAMLTEDAWATEYIKLAACPPYRLAKEAPSTYDGPAGQLTGWAEPHKFKKGWVRLHHDDAHGAHTDLDTTIWKPIIPTVQAGTPPRG